MIRRLLRRLIRWALVGTGVKVVPSYYIRADINIDRSRAEDLLIRGLSSGEGRRVVISTIRQAKLNREL